MPADAVRPSRSLLLPHVVWEVLLLVIAVVLVALDFGLPSDHLRFTQFLSLLAISGLPAAALALSLRTGTPNLAVVGIAGASGLMATKLMAHGWALWPAALVTILIALVIGAIVAVLVALLDLPGWAASLALLAVLTAVILAQSTFAIAPPSGSLPRDPSAALVTLAVVFIIGSIGGGLAWLVPGFTGALGLDDRPPIDRVPLRQRLLAALVGFAGSTSIAALAGVASLIYLQASNPTSGLNLPLVPFAAVVLGGVSVYGRRGGIAGTVLATTILVAFTVLLQTHTHVEVWLVYYVPAAVAIVIGFAVSAAFRVFDRPTPAPFTPVAE